MAIPSLFLKKKSFKGSAKIFVPKGDFPTTLKKSEFLIFSNLMSSDRAECESNDNQLLMIWFLLVLDISEISSPLFFPTWTFWCVNEKLWISIFQNCRSTWEIKHLENFLNFWVSQKWCHSREVNVNRLIVRRKPFELS